MTMQFQRIDYKDVETLKKFLNPHGKIMSRRRTQLSAVNQRALAEAIKRARFMALLPYIVR
ncbi:30S ribosomal protein S18 [Candidatus Parcubacteria bacterium]|nr:30S ribosomal protein S18 [Candidatus Parcubacteria bacterium]